MGTLTEPEHADQALQAGASFLVSPHTEPELARAMTATGLPTMMGALTPSEVMMAKRLGSDVIKLFPGSLTGPSYVKALKGPFPDLRIMPTGGVSVDNVAQWFSAGVFAVGAGSELCPTQLVKEERFDEIVTRAQAFASAVQQARASIR
jgi:2-dehydro-3-deoxyphosphogluconate aldolase/(4S)-4-hydroxy-2-oxoglutarate aldolase